MRDVVSVEWYLCGNEVLYKIWLKLSENHSPSLAITINYFNEQSSSTHESVSASWLATRAVSVSASNARQEQRKYAHAYSRRQTYSHESWWSLLSNFPSIQQCGYRIWSLTGITYCFLMVLNVLELMYSACWITNSTKHILLCAQASVVRCSGSGKWY